MSEDAVAAIALEGLGFAYGSHPVLRDIELEIAAGEIYGLVGADGAGKTTLLRLAVGQLPPSAGSVRVLGRPASDPALRSRLAYMPQGFGLYQDLSVQENLEFFADLHGLEREAARRRIDDLLDRTRLSGFEPRRAGKLSGGMMQKLALACALVSRPQAMVLDEPTTGVDPVSRRAFWRLLDGVRGEGVAILYATADMDEAERCDRVGMLNNGWLVRQGTPLDLAGGQGMALVEISGPRTRRLRAAVAALPGVRLVFPKGRQLRVWLDSDAALEAFRSDLAGLDSELRAEPLPPALQDSALRDLALAEGG